MARLTLTVLFFISIVCFSNASPTSRIVGGDDANDGQLRYQVSLRLNGTHNCGGSIISRTCILTAAHCVIRSRNTGKYIPYNSTLLTVRFGTTDVFKGGDLKTVAKIIYHENYTGILNDVAILYLDEPIIFSDYIQPIKLATFEVPDGEKVIISGWGRVKSGGDSPRQLKYNNELTAISREQCKEDIGMDSDSLICLAHEPGNGICNGDSGGPAVYNDRLVGVAGFIFGFVCGSKYPDGYAKVFYHLDWIKKHSDV